MSAYLPKKRAYSSHFTFKKKGGYTFPGRNRHIGAPGEGGTLWIFAMGVGSP